MPEAIEMSGDLSTITPGQIAAAVAIEDETDTKCTPHGSQTSLKDAADATPSLNSSSTALTLTFLFVTGHRTLLTIDEKLLQSAAMPVKDPQALSILSLKQYLCDHWRAQEWGTGPTSINSLRLIHLGKVLDDSCTLVDYKIIPGGANVVHLSVRPESFIASQPKALERFRSRHIRGANNSNQTGNGGNASSSQERSRGGSCCTIM